MINQIILKKAGAEIIEYTTGKFIISKDEIPQYYYQILEGNVKLHCDKKLEKVS